MTSPLRVIACVMILLATALIGHAADLGKGRIYEAVRVALPPTIDGRLTEACWQEAARSSQFSRVLQGPPDIQQTLFQVVYDDAHVYIAATCLEPKVASIQANVAIDDVSSVMGDDAIEIFFHPDLDAPDYCQFAANSIGTRYDGKAFDASWNADWRAAGSVGEDAWYLECAIPFAAFKRFGAPGATWGFNICRDRNAGGDTEWSAWSDTMGGFHTPDRFGKLIFGGEAGGVSRALMIECARYAEMSIRLEAKINEALGLFEEAGLDTLAPKEREAVQPQIEAAEESLEALREVLSAPSPLDLRAWLEATDKMKKAADALDDAAWDIRFAKLLADD